MKIKHEVQKLVIFLEWYVNLSQVGQLTQVQMLQAMGMRQLVDKNRFPCKVQ
jgi:hypothetical protein